MVKLFLQSFIYIVLFIGMIFPVVAGDRSAEVDSFITTLSSENIVTRLDAAKQITRSGLSDEKLFDFVEQQLLAGYKNDNGSVHRDEMSWYCKVLASSGQEKYRSTLSTVAANASSGKVRKYAKQSLTLIAEYNAANAIINSQENKELELSPEATRVYNMLQSGNIKLQKDAAKMLTRGEVSDAVLYETVQEKLKTGYQEYSNRINTNKEFEDILSWYCKALGASGSSNYRGILEEIVEGSSSIKLKKYAKESLEHL